MALLRRMDDMGKRTSMLIGTAAIIAAGPATYATPQFFSNLDDFPTITGRAPSIVQWEYHDPLWTARYGSAGTDLVRASIIEHATTGAVVVLCHHPGNPVTGALSGTGTTWPIPQGGAGTCWDKTGDPITACLPGGAQRAQFTAYLDRLATFLGTLQVGGRLVPVILRWWHEASGAWAWWNSDKAGYIALWRDTVEYLRDTAGVTNVLYCPNFDYTNDQTGWYPGDAWCDLHSMDSYDNTAAPTAESVGLLAQGYARLIADTNKPLLIPECGYSQWATVGANGIWTDTIATWTTKYTRFAAAILWRTPWGVGADSPSAGRANFAAAVADPRVV